MRDARLQAHNESMVTLELRKLWQLHQIDASLLEIQKRAAALDPGKAIMAQIKALEAEYADKGGRAKALHAEQTDLELQQKGMEDKVAKINKELYGGAVVSPREVEMMEKEIVSIKKRRGDLDERLLELMDLVPPAQVEAAALEKKIHAARVQLKDHQKKALDMKAQLEENYKRFSAARPKAAAEVEKVLLSKYESIRQRHGGVGMAEAKTGSCGACGTRLPERTMTLLKDDKLTLCDNCHRILYYTEGLI